MRDLHHSTSRVPVLGMILKGYPRISETFISNEILLLEKLGFAIHLFSMRRPRENFSHDSVKKIRATVDYLPETLIKPLPRLLYHNLFLAAKQPGVYAAALKAAYRRFSRTHKSATIKHLLQAGYLAHRFLPASGVTHLHAHFAHSPTSVAMFTSHLTGLPFSFTAHAKDIYTSDPRQIREKIGLARFVVTCTEYNRKYLREIADGHATPIHRNYHGIDIKLFCDKNETPKLPVEPYQILTIARLTAKKGLPTIYKALRILCDQGVALHHTHIGGGEDREKIIALINDLELGSVTRLLGTQPHQWFWSTIKMPTFLYWAVKWLPMEIGTASPTFWWRAWPWDCRSLRPIFRGYRSWWKMKKPAFWCLPVNRINWQRPCCVH